MLNDKTILTANPRTISREEYQRLLNLGYRFRGAFLYERARAADFLYVQLTASHREPKRIVFRPDFSKR